MSVAEPVKAGTEKADRTSTLTITDDRTGTTYVLPVENGTIRSADLHKIIAPGDASSGC